MNDGNNKDVLDCEGNIWKHEFQRPDEAVIVGPVDSDEYSLKFPNRGKCYIFNHKIFDAHTKLEEREGTQKDVSLLYCRFRELGFEIEVFEDNTVWEVNDKLTKAGKEDHSLNSCFVCCILTHGDNYFLYAKDGMYPTQNVFAPFKGDVCPTLVGKPKLFFIQACQGKNYDDGVKVSCKESTDSISVFKIPTCADFLIAYSTIPGYFSWRNTKNGSWFIQSLCAELKKHAHNKDLLKILTIVNRKVAFEYESCCKNPKKNKKKQVPFITSTLTRDVKFS